MNISELKRSNLLAQHQDLFEYESDEYKLSETEFEKWANEQSIFKKHHKHWTKLHNMDLPERTWGFLIKHYSLRKKNAYLIKQYPATGYFEAVDSNGKVACLLPDTYNDKPFRVSFYKHNGPISHESFETRKEALQCLVSGKFKHREGALDNLINSNKQSWNRGLFILKWISLQLTVSEGFKADKHNDEVRLLFPELN